MILTIERLISDNDTTIGVMFIDGVFECFTLEDERRENKVRGETRIPSGTYKVELRTEGGLTKKYGNRFPLMHKGMLWLRDVPNFEYIYIHVGNTDKDTEGCILVGRNALLQNMTIQGSSSAYVKLYGKVVEFASREELFVEIIDRDLKGK